MTFKRLRCLRRPRAIICFLLFASFVQLLGRHIVRYELQRIYTPPALSTQAASVYSRFIQISQTHPEYEGIFLNDVGMVRFEPVRLAQDPPSAGFSPEEVREFIELVEDLRHVRCVWAEKRGTFVVFVPSVTYILPMRPGVLYSLNGDNPNESDDEFIAMKRPYALIGGNWYTSKGLVICPSMPGQEYRLPERSYVDHSTRANALAGEGETVEEKRSRISF